MQAKRNMVVSLGWTNSGLEFFPALVSVCLPKMVSVFLLGSLSTDPTKVYPQPPQQSSRIDPPSPMNPNPPTPGMTDTWRLFGTCFFYGIVFLIFPRTPLKLDATCPWHSGRKTRERKPQPTKSNRMPGAPQTSIQGGGRETPYL